MKRLRLLVPAVVLTAVLVPVAAHAAPVTSVSAEGLFDASTTPSDSTGAIGITRYVEAVNAKVGIFDRTLGVVTSATLADWWQAPGAGTSDPQVIWDATTQRFYYTGVLSYSATDLRLAYGFSTNASPGNATSDWCHYDIPYGGELPDYPKLGDSKDFAIIGVNAIVGNAFRGADVIAVGKPPTGTGCPAFGTFPFGVRKNLKVGTATQFTPVPANGIDTKPSGWVLTRPRKLPGTTFGRFKVTRNATTGAPVIHAGSSITVPSYAVPPSAPQLGSTYLIHTFDARLTQAVAAVDPLRGGRFTIWTQHTIAGGAGAMVRWYELDPAAGTVVQRGDVADPSLFVFNAAVSPDRVVNAGTKAFGGSMVLGFDTSSATAVPAIRMVSKQGTGPVSAMTLVRASPGPDEDYSCPVNPWCRWGDYAGATPDPAAPTGGVAGVVWLTDMWTQDAATTGGTAGVSWRSWNWAAQP